MLLFVGVIHTPKVSNPIMNRITILLVAAIAVIAGCSPSGIKGDGVVTTTNRPIADFSAMKANGAYQIKWSSGKPAITISTDQNLLPLITTSVTGDTLDIDWKENLRPTKGIMINVSSASLKEVRLNGAVSLTASNVSGPDLKLESNGASSINVEGSVKNLEANFSGAGNLSAKALQTQTARISLSGACSADVTVTENLDASISGAGVITYGGNPKAVEKNVSGLGKIQSRP
jgi:putative autotransporter adhesin-like protein